MSCASPGKGGEGGSIHGVGVSSYMIDLSDKPASKNKRLSQRPRGCSHLPPPPPQIVCLPKNRPILIQQNMYGKGLAGQHWKASLFAADLQMTSVTVKC